MRYQVELKPRARKDLRRIPKADAAKVVEESDMVTIHPNFLEHEGKKAFVVLPYEEFAMMEEELQEYEDLKQLRTARADEADEPGVPLQEAKKELGL